MDLILRFGHKALSSLDLDFTLTKQKEKNSWLKAFDALMNVTKTLSIPQDPFSATFKFFTDYSNQVVVDAIASNDKYLKSFKNSSSNIIFSPSGGCDASPQFARTGTLAVISGTPGDEKDGFLDIGKIGHSYCLATREEGNFEIIYRDKPPHETCPKDLKAATDLTDYKTLSNDYYAFYIIGVNTLAKGNQKKLHKLKAATASRGNNSSILFSALQRAPKKKFNITIQNAIGGIDVNSNRVLARLHHLIAEDKTADKHTRSRELVSQQRSEDKAEIDGEDSVVFDISNALQICLFNGIKPENCLKGK